MLLADNNGGILLVQLLQASGLTICCSAGGAEPVWWRAAARGQPADIYLIDEPSAYLDSEQRIIAAKVGQRSKFWSHQAKCTIHGEAIMCPYHVGLEGSA